MSPAVDFSNSRWLGEQMHRLATDLYPLHRSITGDGLRETLGILGKQIPLDILEVPSGTEVFDWTVPQEWKMRDAYIADSSGRRIVDYAHSNLHVVNYSQPVDACLTWEQLRPHVHHCADRPDDIPYHTAYFRDRWGFCVTGRQFETLQQGGPWQVVIDSDFFPGSLSLAELRVRGRSDDTMLIHCHTCHPSLANDNLSGIVVAAFLARYLLSKENRLTYRFVFAPATIGAITWLAHQQQGERQQIKHGLVLTLLGDSEPFSYKQTRSQAAVMDRLVPKLLADHGISHRVKPFSPGGYDERQYGSPGIDLPVGRLSRSIHGEFSEYHTSADNLSFVRPEHLAESLRVCIAITDALEENLYPVNRFPNCEPQLGRRGIFRAFGEQDDRGRLQEAMMWTLNLADGRHDVLSIAERAELPFGLVSRALSCLSEQGLVEMRDFPDFDTLPKSHPASAATKAADQGPGPSTRTCGPFTH